VTDPDVVADPHVTLLDSLRTDRALDVVEGWTLLDSIDGAVERLARYVEVGVQEFLLLTLGDDPLTQYERLAAVATRLTDLNPSPSAVGR